MTRISRRRVAPAGRRGPDPGRQPPPQAQMASLQSLPHPAQAAPMGDTAGSCSPTSRARRHRPRPGGSRRAGADGGQRARRDPPAQRPAASMPGLHRHRLPARSRGRWGPSAIRRRGSASPSATPGTQPIVLAYAAGTSTLVDSVGSHFTSDRPTPRTTVRRASARWRGRTADTRFVLAPGESRDAVFQLLKDKPGRATPAGTTRTTTRWGSPSSTYRGPRSARPGLSTGLPGLGPGVDPARPAGTSRSASLSDAVKDLESAAKKFGEIFDGKK